MASGTHLADQITEIMTLLHGKLGIKGKDLASAMEKARYRVPRRVYRHGLNLADSQRYVDHPKLSRMLDMPALKASAKEVLAHLEQIDPGERRKGWILGMLGGMAFNFLAFATLLLVFLRWQGIL